LALIHQRPTVRLSLPRGLGNVLRIFCFERSDETSSGRR
jgi:hypothetical protein